MCKRPSVKGNRRPAYSIWSGVALLLLLAPISFQIASAQSGDAPPENRKEAQPFIVEQSRIVEGKRDPRVRFELRFGEPQENCTLWRFETSGQSNGHAVFELKEPGEKNVLSKLESSPQHFEFVLGDAACNYRIRIERIK